MVELVAQFGLVIITCTFFREVISFAPHLQLHNSQLLLQRRNSNYQKKKNYSPLLVPSPKDVSFSVLTRASSSSSSKIDDSSSSDWEIPKISTIDLNTLDKDGFVVIPNFISEDFTTAIRDEIYELRSKDHFKVARIGQDSTNTLNTEIRVAETCFIDNSRTDRDTILPPSKARRDLTQSLDNLRHDLATNLHCSLESSLNELLYVYYPTGGFYRRHRDAIPGSASTLRTYSLLLYLNKDWEPSHGGCLRMHMDGGGDSLPDDVQPNFLDVEPKAGTLVLFKSDKVPHEVLDTSKERMAVVGWYNRPLTQADAKELLVSGAGADSLVRAAMLGISAVLVAYGVSLVMS